MTLPNSKNNIENLMAQIKAGSISWFQFWNPDRRYNFQKNHRLERFIKTYLQNTGVTVKQSHCGAFYYYGYDRINIVPKCWFIKPIYYYRTIIHEIAHSTGSVNRLNRKEYWCTDIEEYVVEISTYIILQKFGVDDEILLRNLISYCNNRDSTLLLDEDVANKIKDMVLECSNYVLEKGGVPIG